MEPDFFARAGAGEKAPAPGCCCVVLGYCGGKVVTILIKFNILTIYTQLERKNRNNFKKGKLFALVFKTAFLIKLVKIIFIRSRESVKIGQALQHCIRDLLNPDLGGKSCLKCAKKAEHLEKKI